MTDEPKITAYKGCCHQQWQQGRGLVMNTLDPDTPSRERDDNVAAMLADCEEIARFHAEGLKRYGAGEVRPGDIDRHAAGLTHDENGVRIL